MRNKCSNKVHFQNSLKRTKPLNFTPRGLKNLLPLLIIFKSYKWLTMSAFLESNGKGQYLKVFLHNFNLVSFRYGIAVPQTNFSKKNANFQMRIRKKLNNESNSIRSEPGEREEKNMTFLCSDLGKSIKYMKLQKRHWLRKKPALNREDWKHRPEKPSKFQ